MMLPEQVRTAVTDYLTTVDHQAPGLVQGLYLVGSVALGDFRPRVSDIDFAAVSEEPLDSTTARAVRGVHKQLARQHPRPRFNGPYVTWADLASDPRDTAPGTHVRGNGVVHTGTRAERHPVTWHTLAQAGVTVRGPGTSTIEIWTDRTGLSASVRENLDSYWRLWQRQGSRLLSRPGLATLLDWGPAWCGTRRHDALAFLDYAITDAHRIGNHGDAG